VIRPLRGSGSRLIAAHFIYDEEMAHFVHLKDMTEDALLDARTTHLQRWAREVAGDSFQLECVVAVGHPFAEVVKIVCRERVSLLVLGAQGESHEDRDYAVGFLAQSCLRRCPCEIMLVRKDHTRPFTKVVVAVDFSENSKRAVREAVMVARAEGASLDVVHVFAPAWQRFGTEPEEGDAMQGFLDELRERFTAFTFEELDDVAGVEVKFEIRESANAAHGIIDFAHEAGADLIVLGTVGRAPEKLQLPGSTAERVIQTSPCSVLSVRPSSDFSWV